MHRATFGHGGQGQGSLRKREGQRWPCEVCGFEFGEVYGAMGAGYIEAHHNVDLSLLASESGHKSTLNDFKMLCSNCHRMVQTQRPSMSVEALKNALGTLN